VRSTDLAISFFTFLTVLANLATVGVVGLAVVSLGRSPAARRLWSAARAELTEGGLGVAWLVAAVCTAGSLWFSEVAGFQPCRLCWIQRACMYPLTLVLAVALWAHRRAAVPATTVASPPDHVDPANRARAVARWSRQLALVMAAVGAVVATYHVLVERFPTLETGACDPEVPCTVVWFERLGFVTLPYMALSGFVLIVTLVVASSPARRPDQRPVPSSAAPVPQEVH
jgi:disulfide bond formation protein DsbB